MERVDEELDLFARRRPPMISIPSPSSAATAPTTHEHVGRHQGRKADVVGRVRPLQRARR